MNPFVQRALIGAGIGGAAGVAEGGLRGGPEGRGKRMLTHGLGGAALGGAVGAGSQAVSNWRNPMAQGVSALDPKKAKIMNKVHGVLGKANLQGDLGQHVNEYHALANKANLTQADVARMQGLTKQYGADNSIPEHARNFFNYGSHRYAPPSVKVSSYMYGAACAAELLGE